MLHLFEYKSFFENRSNTIGILASSLCLVHCIATPFLFVSQLCSQTCCNSSPTYWQLIDYGFLIISFIAVYQSAKNSDSNIIKNMLWISWFALAGVLINEKLQLMALSEFSIYIPAFTLIILPLYNKKYCECHTESCCANNLNN